MREDPEELCGVQAVNEIWISGLMKALSRTIRVDKIILFGSRAEGEHSAWSDYDLCVISPDFEGMKPWKRMEMVLACWTGERAIEAICYTPVEFGAINNTLIQEIRRKGRVLQPADGTPPMIKG